jgi:hypothetical protein
MNPAKRNVRPVARDRGRHSARRSMSCALGGRSCKSRVACRHRAVDQRWSTARGTPPSDRWTFPNSAADYLVRPATPSGPAGGPKAFIKQSKQE